FAEALEYLRSMETAKWRRPNPSGNWGIVSAVRWDKLRK
ncbi:XRE family transcriptional regulator, partial [Escherichia coli]